MPDTKQIWLEPVRAEEIAWDEAMADRHAGAIFRWWVNSEWRRIESGEYTAIRRAQERGYAGLMVSSVRLGCTRVYLS